MSEKPLVSIIIPSAADPSLLRACLRSLEENAPKSIPFETIVVLNRPTDHVEVLRESPVKTSVVHSSVNLGLAGAGNRARARASGEYLLILHDDSEVEPGWMEALLDAAREHPEAGAIGGMVLYPDRTLQSAGMVLWRDGTTSPPWIAAPSRSEFATARAVDYTGTSSLLIRAATWDAIGGFDEQFYPVYYVDVDFAMRVRQLGQIVWYEPRSKTRHQQGASGDLRWREFVMRRNRERFVEKWRRELEDHEARVNASPEAVSRAMARARARAGRAQPDLMASPQPIDEAKQDRSHLEMDLSLHRAYAAHLATALQNTEAQVDALLATRAEAALPFVERIAAIEEENIRLAQTLADATSDTAILQQSRDDAVGYRRALESQLERLIAASTTLKHSLADTLKQRHALETELRDLKSRRWWRLYDKLQPVMRIIAKIAPRTNRP